MTHTNVQTVEEILAHIEPEIRMAMIAAKGEPRTPKAEHYWHIIEWLRETLKERDAALTTQHERETEQHRDMEEEMWGIICNVFGEQSQEWTDAMYRVREKYFKSLAKLPQAPVPVTNEDK